VTIESARFKIPSPGDTDIPNAPAQYKSQADKIDELLGLAGAQSKATIISTEQSRESASYGALTTPDKVEGIVVPTKSLLYIVYQAAWANTTLGSGRAAIFIGANQLRVGRPASTTGYTQAAMMASGAGGAMTPLSTFENGLISVNAGGSAYAAVTSGQAIGVAPDVEQALNVELGGTQRAISVGTTGSFFPMRGGACVVFLNAGTYDISVQYKTTLGGIVSAKDRRLYVWTQEFA
jgi:hypothetical protein